MKTCLTTSARTQGILQNKYTEDEWNAYYEGKIEPFAIQLSLVMSNMTYTARELSFGNAITIYREPLTIRKQSNEAEYQHTVI